MRSRVRLDIWLVFLATPLLLSCAGRGDLDGRADAAASAEAAAVQPGDEVDDGMDVYFRDSDLEALAEQELASYSESDAGESERLARSFPDAPPQIPHAVEDMLPITAEDNECLECHHPSNAIGGEDLPLPKSHFRQPVMGEGEQGQGMVWVVKSYEQARDLVGSRYNCDMCHTPQAGNARVVRSSFGRIEGEPTQ